MIKHVKDDPIYNPPILVQPGNGQDSASWLQELNEHRFTPFPLQLARKGFIVWMMNNRGTEYSRDHVRFDKDSAEYWDYDFFDEWKDIEANVRVMKSYTGYDDLYYVGYSGATAQMLYGMVEDTTKLQNKLRKAVFLAPCTTPKSAPPGALGIWKSDIDVHSFSGPSWSEDKLKACTVLPEADCDQLNSYDKL